MPFLEQLQGKERYKPYKAILSSDIKKPEGFRCFFKASSYLEETQQMVTSLKGQASFMVKPMLIANSWVVLPEEHSLIQKGTIVEVYSL